LSQKQVAYPKVFSHKVVKEEETLLTVKGIEFRAYAYETDKGIKGYRIPIENNGELFQHFKTWLEKVDAHRGPKERSLDLYQFKTILRAEKSLDIFGDAGFYVYRGHVIFNEEEGQEKTPMERIIIFIEYFKKKFNIKTRVRKSVFQVLDELDLGILEE